MFLYLNHPVPHREENASSHRRDALVLAVAAVVLSAIIINVFVLLLLR